VTIRVAGAPISWGVCEVPGWGHQLSAERVLTELTQVAGLTAMEFGPDGFLPAEPSARTALLARHGLTAVGGFVPLVLHDTVHDPLSTVDDVLPAFTASGADTLVLAAATGLAGYDSRPELDAGQWRTLLSNLDRITERAAAAGVTATLHPHVGTLVESEADVRRVLAGSAVPLCLDTGHLLIGGTDPVALAREVPERIAHVHLKDVDAARAAEVRSGRSPYSSAVRDGLYRPLGRGDIDIAAIVTALSAVDYAGWYVLEQDTVLTAEPPAGAGPVDEVRESLAFLRKVAT
jgi:inosose dehydratase